MKTAGLVGEASYKVPRKQVGAQAKLGYRPTAGHLSRTLLLPMQLIQSRHTLLSKAHLMLDQGDAVRSM